MDQQGKSSHLLFKRNRLQNQTLNAGPKNHDASLKSRLVYNESITTSTITVWWKILKRDIICPDTKMDRKDKLFVVNEVSLF